MLDIKTGDIVYLLEEMTSAAGTSARETTVTSVGRKWFTVDGNELRFSRESGDSSGPYTYPRVVSAAQFHEETERRLLEGKLRARGVRLQRRQPVPVLERLLAAFTPEDGRPS